MNKYFDLDTFMLGLLVGSIGTSTIITLIRLAQN